MKLRLNLSTTPQVNNRPFLAGAVLAGTVGFLSLLILSHAAYRSWQSSRALRTDTAYWREEIRIEQERQQALGAYFKTPAAGQVLERSAFLNSLIGARSFPWTKIFTDLEQTIPPGVHIVTISPRLVNGRAQLELQVGAVNDESKIQFLQAVEKSKVFSGMEVKQEHRSEQAGSSDKIVLDVSVWYTTT